MTEHIGKSKVQLKEFDSSQNFDRQASSIKMAIWYLVKIIFFLSALPYPNSLKCIILRFFGAKIGNGVIIKPRVNIHFPWKLVVGDHVWIGEEAFILNFEQINIGSNVCISQRAFLCGGNHDYRVPSMPYRNGPITLEAGCWIGAGCFVAPNVIIGADTVVSAYTVVTKSLDPNGVYRGNPAVHVAERWKNQ